MHRSDRVDCAKRSPSCGGALTRIVMQQLFQNDDFGNDRPMPIGFGLAGRLEAKMSPERKDRLVGAHDADSNSMAGPPIANQLLD